MWCARSEPDEGRCPYDRRRARSECGLCVGVLVVSAAWPHDVKDVCRLKWATLWARANSGTV